MPNPSTSVLLVAGEAIARYGFPGGHPFGTDRHEAFMTELCAAGLMDAVWHAEPRMASREELLRFHPAEYLDLVAERSQTGMGALDGGDTPAFKGMYEAAAHVVGSSLLAAQSIMTQQCRRAFVPIAGLHHAARAQASGFCIFNDCGVVIETLRQQYGLTRIAYVDIDAHHGDGVFYAYEDDPNLLYVDVHEDGQHLYPGTGAASETGSGAAAGTKLNLPVAPGSDDAVMETLWPRIQDFLEAGQPQFIVLQCGADSLAGDPLAHLAYSEATHAMVTARLCQLAERLGHGRVLALGGGGYNRRNLARAWTRVVQSLLS